MLGGKGDAGSKTYLWILLGRGAVCAMDVAKEDAADLFCGFGPMSTGRSRSFNWVLASNNEPRVDGGYGNGVSRNMFTVPAKHGRLTHLLSHALPLYSNPSDPVMRWLRRDG